MIPKPLSPLHHPHRFPGPLEADSVGFQSLGPGHWHTPPQAHLSRKSKRRMKMKVKKDKSLFYLNKCLPVLTDIINFQISSWFWSHGLAINNRAAANICWNLGCVIKWCILPVTWGPFPISRRGGVEAWGHPYPVTLSQWLLVISGSLWMTAVTPVTHSSHSAG